LVENRQFEPSLLLFGAPLGISRNFAEIFDAGNLESLGYRIWRCLCDPRLVILVPCRLVTDRCTKTDRQTDSRHTTKAYTALA